MKYCQAIKQIHYFRYEREVIEEWSITLNLILISGIVKQNQTFYRYRDILVNLSDMDTIQATHFLENVYSSVARDYGDE